MVLGEALSLRARQAMKLNDLKGRIKNCATSQEGTTPPEDVNELIGEYLEVSGEHQALLVKIARTNTTTVVGGVTLLELMQHREALIRSRNLYSMAADAGSQGESGYRFTRTELKYVANVDVPALRKSEDEGNEAIRVLDAQIQATNWSTELL